MLVFYLIFSTLIRLVRPCSMYHISLNNKRGDYLLFSHQKGADDYSREAIISNIGH